MQKAPKTRSRAFAPEGVPRGDRHQKYLRGVDWGLTPPELADGSAKVRARGADSRPRSISISEISGGQRYGPQRQRIVKATLELR